MSEEFPVHGFFSLGDYCLVNKIWRYGIQYYPAQGEDGEFVAYFGDGFEWVYERFTVENVSEFWTPERHDEFLKKWKDTWGIPAGGYGLNLIALKESFLKRIDSGEVKA